MGYIQQHLQENRRIWLQDFADEKSRIIQDKKHMEKREIELDSLLERANQKEKEYTDVSYFETNSASHQFQQLLRFA